jgi:hypothetical protein
MSGRRTELSRDRVAMLHRLLELVPLLCEAAGRTTRAWRGRLAIPRRIRRDLAIKVTSLLQPSEIRL